MNQIKFLSVKWASVIPALLFLAGCVTPLSKEVSKVKPGMMKWDVLDTLGSPTISERRSGRDRWTYVYFDGNKRQGRVIEFENGEVSSVKPLRFILSAREKLQEASSIEEYEQHARAAAAETEAGFTPLE